MPRKNTRVDYLKLAKDRNLTFLFDGEPEGSKILYEWMCPEGHKFFIRYCNVLQGQGCQKCYDDRRGQTLVYGIEKYHELATKRNLRFIDKRIPHHTHIPFEWECPDGHKWEASYHNIDSRGSGCPGCYGNQKLIIDDYYDLAKKRNLKFLDEDIPPNNHTDGNWKCTVGHKWSSSYHNIDRGSGCPYCWQFSSEKMCREIFEEITGYTFPKSRDKFLEGLELDGYNKDLNIAFEYNGEQHYKYIPHFHRKGEIDIEKQKERDEKKIRLCIENNIDLIIIPYTFSFKIPDLLKEYISEKLSEHIILM